VVVESEREPLTVGELIRFWRARRRLSQLELALGANLSTKHLSFVETGRSRPSRQLLIHPPSASTYRWASATGFCSRAALLRPT
jgi:transcriptional regulator with XRE-family HTH domain